MFKTIRDYRTYRNTKRDMRRLSDAQLLDIGVPRWRIDDVARGAAVRPADVL